MSKFLNRVSFSNLNEEATLSKPSPINDACPNIILKIKIFINMTTACNLIIDFYFNKKSAGIGLGGE